MVFSELKLDNKIISAINDLGYVSPTPIQKEVIPKILNGFDLRASAPTGTGKTAAFILPALNRLMTPSKIKGRGPRVLILVPTRELALQIMTQTKKYSKNISLVKTISIFGGVPYREQNKDLRSHYEILIATPGRLIDHMEKGAIDFSRVELLVLDEADRMLDMGFIEPVKHIANSINNNHQTLLFSATMQGEVLKLSESLLKEPIEINVKANVEESKNIEQRLHYVDNIHQKHQLLSKFLKEPEFEQVLVFTSTKRLADELAEKLKDQDFKAAALHGDMKQRKRTRTIMEMRKGKIKILIATDVAARGIDVRTITHVINFDLPQIAEDYVHRIGRTGRAGDKGIALSFVSPRDFKMLKDIEKFIGHKIDKTNEANVQSNFFEKSHENKGDFRKNDRYRKNRNRDFKRGYEMKKCNFKNLEEEKDSKIKKDRKKFFPKSENKKRDFSKQETGFKMVDQIKKFTYQKIEEREKTKDSNPKSFFSRSRTDFKGKKFQKNRENNNRRSGIANKKDDLDDFFD